MNRRLLSLFLLGLIFAMPLYAGRKRGPDRLVDSDEYKEGEFEKGIIEDYSDMVEGDGVEWVYLSEGLKLSSYKIDLGEFKNVSSITNSDMIEALEEGFPNAFRRIGLKGSAGTLKAESAVYWAERASQGKKWIPYAGGHLAQAGVGLEMVLRDSSGKVVAKLRHSTRQGEQLDEAAEEIVDDIADFIRKN